jgi:hypothetical protein
MKKIIQTKQPYRAVAPDFSVFSVGDTLTITEEVKLALDQYGAASTKPTLQGIIEKQAQACDVLSKLFYGNVVFKSLADTD